MPDAVPAFKAAPFFARLRRAGRRALLLDYDGTLAPFRARREEAFPYPGVIEALEAIARTGRTRLALVTGRSVESLLPLLGMDRPPEIWGSHGLERRLADGTYRAQQPPPAVARFLAEAERRFGGAERRSVYEQKPFGFALHRRADPELYQVLLEEAMELWKSSGPESDVEVLEFDGGVEFRPAGRHKGEVVAAILAELSPETVAAYLGDDAGDEDAFRAIKGRGMGVLVRESPRPTAADVWIRPPEQLLEFLDAWRAEEEIESAAEGGTASAKDGAPR